MRYITKAFVVMVSLALSFGMGSRAEAQVNQGVLTPPTPRESQFYFDGQQWRLVPQSPQQGFPQQPQVNPNQTFPPNNGNGIQGPTPNETAPLPPIPNKTPQQRQPVTFPPVNPTPRLTVPNNQVPTTPPPRVVQPAQSNLCYLVYYRACPTEPWRAYGPFPCVRTATSYACRMDRVGWITRVVVSRR